MHLKVDKLPKMAGKMLIKKDKSQESAGEIN